MERIINIETIGNVTSALFLTKDIAEVNMLKRAIMSEIDTYAIDIVIFQTNTSPRHDEILALRLGQLVIDHTRFLPPQIGDFRTHIDFKGPGELTTDNIPGLPFKYKTPVVLLKDGQHVICDVIVKKGQGKQHVKWRPVSRVSILDVEDGHKITFNDIGMLTPIQIIQNGYAKIRDAAHRVPITLFSHPLVPENIQ